MAITNSRSDMFFTNRIINLKLKVNKLSFTGKHESEN